MVVARFCGGLLILTSSKLSQNLCDLFSLSDNRDGVPENKRQYIFEDFFTTKPAGKGTGFELSMCVKIVEDHDGRLTIMDDPDLEEARFELWLPVEKKWGVA